MEGKSMKVHLLSLGCARNLVDSEEMLADLRKNQQEICENPENADVIIVNTCSFIESAAQESVDTILELARLKKEGACRCLIVTGCLPERYRESIAEEIPEVDLFLGTGAFDRIAEAVSGTLPSSASRCILPDPDAIAAPGPDLLRISTSPHTAYLKIAEGCSRHCTYCIIPRLRGKQKSRRPETILTEARRFLESGVKELVLVAQDSTAYGTDLRESGTESAGLASLLTSLSDLSAKLAPENRIRVLYGHPESIHGDIIRVMAARENICSYYDLPVQHAADSVLKKMGRHHSRKDLCRLFEKIRKTDPHAVLRSTVIVGFPGESDTDFAELLDFVREIRFDHLGAFTYSDAEDLPSHGLPRHVPKKTVQERLDRLMNLQKEISEEKNQDYLDKILKVLIEELPEDNVAEGRTAFQAPEVDGMVFVHHRGSVKTGEFVQVKITDSLEYDLVGDALV